MGIYSIIPRGEEKKKIFAKILTLIILNFSFSCAIRFFFKSKGQVNFLKTSLKNESLIFFTFLWAIMLIAKQQYFLEKKN